MYNDSKAFVFGRGWGGFKIKRSCPSQPLSTVFLSEYIWLTLQKND
jgi:hypothetical protein